VRGKALRSALLGIRRRLMICGGSLKGRDEEVPILHSAPAIGVLKSESYMLVDERSFRSKCR
jgi:hypothetical protein